MEWYIWGAEVHGQGLLIVGEGCWGLHHAVSHCNPQGKSGRLFGVAAEWFVWVTPRTLRRKP